MEQTQYADTARHPEAACRLPGGERAPAHQPAIHRLPVAAVYAALATQPYGLTQTEAAERLQRYGRNVIREIKGTPLVLKFLANFTHLMAILLWVGGLIGFIAQMPQLGIAIWTVNLINGAFSFWQEYKAEQAVAALRRLLPTYARVLRDATEQRILAEELVPGDVLLLAEGDHISADGRLVQEAELRLDQSTLSGESHPVRKTSEAVLRDDLARVETPNLVFAGTNVAAGVGMAIIFATGMDSEFGKIAHLTQSVGEEPSPLQKELGRITKTVTVLATSIGLVFFVLAIVLAGVDLAAGFIFAMGIIVAFVPEGMLPTVTLALALGVQRMAKRHALVKRLSAVETLGCTTVICTDKTGTLTQNEMTVCGLWLAGRRLTVSGAGYVPEGQILDDRGRLVRPADGDLRALLVAAELCNDARLLPPNGESPRWTVLGDPTEAALHVVALKSGLDLAAEAKLAPRLYELPFESRRKRMTSVHQVGSSPVAYVKGAPTELLRLCRAIWMDGQERMLDDALRAQIVAANDDYARGGLRVLAVARRPLPDNQIAHTPEAIERDLTFLGLVAMLDPPRPEVATAVAQCHRAGIRIIMITGDYGLTAESVARRIGIIRDTHPRILTGADLDTISDAALKTALQGSTLR